MPLRPPLTRAHSFSPSRAAHPSLLPFAAVIAIVLGLAAPRTASAAASPVAPDATLQKLADGFAFTEGPAADKDGNVFFTDQPNDRIVRWDATTRTVSDWRKPSGRANGTFFDAHGNLWSTLIMADRLIAITPEGEVLVLLDDGRPEATAALDAAWREGCVTPDLMAAATGTIAPWMASLTFGGPDLKTVYLGSLRGSRIPSFRSPVAGLPLIYWNERKTVAA